MTAFNTVRFKVKTGRNQEFLDAHESVDRDWPGLRHVNIIQTGDQNYAIIGEWDDMDALAAARPNMIATLAPAEHFRPDGSVATERLTSAGRPTPLTTVAIMGEQGALLPRGERGEIVVRGPLVMDGYHENPKATAEVGAFGWHHTGDIGYLNDEGLLFVVDRAKDMIITGGFNVYSAEVEQALLAHPAVKDSAVVGLPDPKWGERVTAAVELRIGQQVVGEEIIDFVKQRIGSVKAPKEVEIWSELPRSKVGKILKGEVRATMLDTRTT